MKKSALALVVLLSLLPFAPSMAQAPAVAGSDSNAAAAPAPDAIADFLATLSDGQARTTDDQTPAPMFTSGCTSNSQCPTGQLCCYMCGALPDGDDSFCRMCVTPERNRCPIVA